MNQRTTSNVKEVICHDKPTENYYPLNLSSVLSTVLASFSSLFWLFNVRVKITHKLYCFSTFQLIVLFFLHDTNLRIVFIPCFSCSQVAKGLLSHIGLKAEVSLTTSYNDLERHCIRNIRNYCTNKCNSIECCGTGTCGALRLDRFVSNCFQGQE